jgi:hypothetical protein
MGVKRNACRILVGKPEEIISLGRTRPRWVDNIKIYLSKIRWGDEDWIHLAQDKGQWRALANTFEFHTMLGNTKV